MVQLWSSTERWIDSSIQNTVRRRADGLYTPRLQIGYRSDMKWNMYKTGKSLNLLFIKCIQSKIHKNFWVIWLKLKLCTNLTWNENLLFNRYIQSKIKRLREVFERYFFTHDPAKWLRAQHNIYFCIIKRQLFNSRSEETCFMYMEICFDDFYGN